MEFPVFFAQTRPSVLARALMLTDNRQDAEDAVQDAYAEAMRRWAELDGRAPVEWVHGAVRRRLWAAARRWRRHRPLELVVSLPARCSTEQAAEVRLVLDGLAKLPRRQRVVAYLHWVEDRTAAEIAAELGTGENAVRAWIGKARTALEAQFGLTGIGEQKTLSRPVRWSSGPGQSGPLLGVLGMTLLRAELALCEGSEQDSEALARISRGLGLP